MAGDRSRTVNLINGEALTKTYGTRTLLDSVSLGVGVGERIGVVGRNGDGKSTLLRLLARHETPDSGRLTQTSDLRIGWLAQHDDLDPDTTVRHSVLGDRVEHEWAADRRVRSVLAALLGDVSLDAPIAPLSGGERRRVALARLLVSDFDLLLLDEPTNHLDMEAIDWLARHLAAGPAALIAVTHDRWFLDTVADTTWEVYGGAVSSYEGGYSAYVLAKAERSRIAAAEEGRRQNLIRKELAWLRRGPPARTSKPKFRIEAANALIADEPPARDRLELQRFATTRLGRSVIDLHDVSVDLPDGRVLLDRLTWHLGPGDRVGLVGANGAGKTTLLRVLAGDLPVSSGKVKTGRTVSLAHLSQTVAELDPQLRVLEAVEQIRRVVQLGDGREMTASSLLERFGFTGDRLWTRVGELSGGERRRLQLLRLLMAEPNVLFLDEPTNDLDVETLQVLEDLLDAWPGSLVLVSHDRWFLERVSDDILGLLGDGSLRHLPGGVEEYLALRAAGGAKAQGRSPEPATDPTGHKTQAALSQAEVRAARKELARLESNLSKIDAKQASLLAAMADSATDFVRISELDEQLRQARAEQVAVEERWLELSDLLE